MSASATAVSGEWYGAGGSLPEVMGTASGPDVDFINLAEQCAAGKWPSKDEGHRILKAAGRTVPQLIGLMRGLRSSRSGGTVAEVVMVQTAPAVDPEIERLHQLEKEFSENQDFITRMGISKEQYMASADRKQRARTDPNLAPMARINAEFENNATTIASLGVSKDQYVLLRQRNELEKRGIDPSFLDVGK